VLLLLGAVALAIAFTAGTAIGVGAQSGGWGAIAILAAIPVALLAGLIAGRALLAAALSMRRARSASWITDKLEPLRLVVRDDAPVRIDIVHPAIDLKHFFGGFIAVFNLARRLSERGHRVRVIALDEPGLPRDWRAQLARYEGIGDSVEGLEVCFAADRCRPVEMNPGDALIATHWTAAHVAATALGDLRAERFLYLIQEYEPFIFPMGSAAALARASYELPHAALFSTEPLRNWFAEHAIGVFAGGRVAGEQDSLSFDNAITPVGPVTPAELRRPPPGRLLFYARPEEHGSRNMFELGAMALDAAICSGSLEGWELAGVGTVEPGSRTVTLPGSGASLRLLPRAPQAEYARLLRGFDLGLALMYTPHPSLVPIEMCAAGMCTVTNSFETKDAAALHRISSNLIVAEPSVDSIAAALTEAEARTGEIDSRATGSQVQWPASWDDALDSELMAEIELLVGVGT
jgi:hypothetical protein